MNTIFGQIRLDGGQADPRELAEMAGALTVHGPDGGGLWSDRAAGLGHRLTRITPDDCFDRQPITSADGRLILVFAGRLDNRSELLANLGRGPRAIEETPDSQLRCVLWGDGASCLSRLVGDFALSVWNTREQQLFLARSPLSLQPMYYWRNASAVAFATMPKGLFALSYVPRELDRERLADFLVSAPPDQGSSFYRGIQRLPAGHCMRISRGQREIRRFWSPPALESLSMSDADCIEAARSLFDRAVSDRLRCHTPVGIMMSGGLDSTSVAASAAISLGPEHLSTFTEVPSEVWCGKVMPGRYGDETRYVEAMRRRYSNLESNLIRADGRFYLDRLAELFHATEEPYANASNRVWVESILEFCQQRGLRAVLTGAAGNLTISWPGRDLLPRLLRGAKWSRALREARGLRKHGQARSTLRALAAHGIMPLLPPPLWRAVQRLRNPRDSALRTSHPWLVSSMIHPEFARSQRILERAAAKSHDFRPGPVSNSRQLRIQTLEHMNDGLSGIITGYRTLYGVEMRDPTSDQRLVDFCLSLPEEMYLRDGTSRYLMREAMASRLPNEILAQRQRGQQGADWLDRYLAASSELECELEGQEGCELAREILDLPRLRTMVANLPKVTADDKNVIRDVRGVLDKALMMGRFLRWFESGE
jgi:asparagine synthase (glutamine-hydrolysing)